MKRLLDISRHSRFRLKQLCINRLKELRLYLTNSSYNAAHLSLNLHLVANSCDFYIVTPERFRYISSPFLDYKKSFNNNAVSITRTVRETYLFFLDF